MTAVVSEGILINRTTVRLIKDDITDLDAEAFVYYAQHDLQLGSGFGTAISGRGGPSVQRELDEFAPRETCDAVLTTAGRMKADYIIHAVGPRFLESDLAGKLRTTMTNTLNVAEEKGIKRLAFPAMGAGYYGIPYPLCARVMFEVIAAHLEGGSCLEEIIVCVLDSPQFNAFKPALETLSQREGIDR